MVFIFIFFISLVLFLGLLIGFRYALSRGIDSGQDYFQHEPDLKMHATKIYEKATQKGHEYAKTALRAGVETYRSVRDNTTFFVRLKNKIRRYLYDHTPGHKKSHPANFLDHVKKQYPLDENTTL
jgi:hypothetical protein